jgi:hypothetical protein
VSTPREQKIFTAYMSGFIDAVWYEKPTRPKRPPMPRVQAAYAEGFLSGKLHREAAEQRAKAYAAQLCHVAPKEK